MLVREFRGTPGQRVDEDDDLGSGCVRVIDNVGRSAH
jgi:hypothetical protein